MSLRNSRSPNCFRVIKELSNTSIAGSVINSPRSTAQGLDTSILDLGSLHLWRRHICEAVIFQRTRDVFLGWHWLRF